MVEATAQLYELTADPAHERIMTAFSHLDGQKINRNLQVNRSTGDLERRTDMALLPSRTLRTCNYCCVGCDTINALASVTFYLRPWQVSTEYGGSKKLFFQEVENWVKMQ